MIRSFPYLKAGIYVLLLCSFLFGENLSAQLRQDTSKRVQYLVIPVIFNTPENGFAYGISGSLSFNIAGKRDTSTRTSVIQALGFLTTKRQNVQVIDATIFFPKEKFVLLGQTSHSYFPDRFWGVGPDTKNNNWEHYIFEQVYVSPHLKREVAKHLLLGLIYEFQTVYNIQYLSGGIFDNAAFYGKNNYTVSGVGCSVSYDSRNITFWPSKGIYFTSQLTDFGRVFLSDYTLLKWVTDLRWFKKTGKNQVLAMQLYNYQTYGNTPLRELAVFGGPNNMRGFYQGRFRANNMATLIAEYRVQLLKRVSGVAFAGAGNVYNHYSELRANNIKYSYGAGIRFSLLEKEQLNIRVDYGYSDAFNKGLYVTVGECF